MKKFTLLLIALAFILTSCNKTKYILVYNVGDYEHAVR